MTKSEIERIIEAQGKAAEIIRASQKMSALTTPSPAVTEAIRGFEKLKLGNATAFAEAAKAFEPVQPVIAQEIAESMKAYKESLVTPGITAALQSYSEVGPTVPKGFTDFRVADVVQGSLAAALSDWQLPAALIRDMSEAMRRTAVVPGPEIGPLTAEVIRRAAEVAEDPATAEVASDAAASLDLDEASPEKRRAIRNDLPSTIGGLATLAAYFVHNRQLELAAILLAVIAPLIALLGDIGDE